MVSWLKKITPRRSLPSSAVAFRFLCCRSGHAPAAGGALFSFPIASARNLEVPTWYREYRAWCHRGFTHKQLKTCATLSIFQNRNRLRMQTDRVDKQTEYLLCGAGDAAQAQPTAHMRGGLTLHCPHRRGLTFPVQADKRYSEDQQKLQRLQMSTNKGRTPQSKQR